jgi:hypothetical protein
MSLCAYFPPPLIPNQLPRHKYLFAQPARSYLTRHMHAIRSPERWERQPEKSKAVPGLFANTLTFLNGNFVHGNRSCIGWQFALTECVASLSALLFLVQGG